MDLSKYKNCRHLDQTVIDTEPYAGEMHDCIYDDEFVYIGILLDDQFLVKYSWARETTPGQDLQNLIDWELRGIRNL